MAVKCPLCNEVHSVQMVCDISKKHNENFRKEVEYHKLHHPNCPNPKQHVLELRQRNTTIPPKFGSRVWV
ncbi:MAG: hypothetical protein ABH887_02430 [bacterium]